VKTSPRPGSRSFQMVAATASNSNVAASKQPVKAKGIDDMSRLLIPADGRRPLAGNHRLGLVWNRRQHGIGDYDAQK
jgi:hypothetical protein